MQKENNAKSFLEIDNETFDEEEIDTLNREDFLEDTQKINVINEEDLLSNTSIDIFGDDKNE